MLPSEELIIIYKKQLLTIEEEVMNLFRRFIKVSPVDTGAFRSAWEVDQVSPREWIITNNTEYATILFDGRRFVGGQWVAGQLISGQYYGSDQWPDGGGPILELFNRRLQKKLDRIKV